MKAPPHPLVFYDGVCGLCNRSVRWLIRHDRKRVLRYTSLQSEFSDLLPHHLRPSGIPGTIIFKDGERYYEKSDAIIRILLKMKGMYSLAGMLFIIPRPVRNIVYDWVSRNRYKWFGKYDTCPLPEPGDRELFVDHFPPE